MLRILTKILVALVLVLITSTITDRVAQLSYPVGVGKSMLPFSRDGQRSLFIRPWREIRTGDVVLVVTKKDESIKRVAFRAGMWVWLLGDNRKESWDSRHYGWVNIACIRKLCLLRLPRLFDGETCNDKPRGVPEPTDQQKADSKAETERLGLVKASFLRSCGPEWHKFDGTTLKGSSATTKRIDLPEPSRHIGIISGGSAGAPIKVIAGRDTIGECRGTTGGIKEFTSQIPIDAIELKIEAGVPDQTVTLEAVRKMPSKN